MLSSLKREFTVTVVANWLLAMARKCFRQSHRSGLLLANATESLTEKLNKIPVWAVVDHRVRT